MERSETPNIFKDALEQLYQLHTNEIQVLRTKLRDQTELLNEKERQIEKMRKNVSKAKKKIQQQSDRIQLLESQFEPNVSEVSVENFKPHFNKTTVSLFGNSPPVSVATSTPSEEVIVINREQQFLTTNSLTRNEAGSETDSECTDISVEELMTRDKDKDLAVAEIELMDQPQTVHKVDVTNVDASRVLDPPQTCVSLFGDSVKTSPRKSLHLRRQTNTRIKYKETSNVLSEFPSLTSHETYSPNALNETSELPSPGSPRFLVSTPHYSRPSPGSASVPLFYSTTKTANIDTSKLDTSPSGDQYNPIPISDSQFSLDVSQSCPPSPELCGGSGSIQSTNQQCFQSSTPNDEILFPSLPHTPSSLVQATIIPITPGITTVQTILGRTANGISNGNKRQLLQEREEASPVRKKKQLFYENDLQENGSDDEFIEDGSKPVIKGQKKHVSNEDKEKAHLTDKYDLPPYACVTKILKKSDRDKLDGKACPECNQWFDGCAGIHDDKRQHLKHTCRHKNLHLPPDTDPKLWDISFPDSDVCERIMQK